MQTGLARRKPFLDLPRALPVSLTLNVSDYRVQYWDGGGNGAVPPEAAGTGPLPHSRMVGASPMAIDIDTFDVWYWGNGSVGEGRQLHPSSRLWATKDSGSILDDDNVGSWVESPAGEWCAEAVQPVSMTLVTGPVLLGCVSRLMRCVPDVVRPGEPRGVEGRAVRPPCAATNVAGICVAFF